jgi:hypothetical protein
MPAHAMDRFAAKLRPGPRAGGAGVSSVAAPLSVAPIIDLRLPETGECS